MKASLIGAAVVYGTESTWNARFNPVTSQMVAGLIKTSGYYNQLIQCTSNRTLQYLLHIELPLKPSLSIPTRRVCAEPPALEPQAPPVQRGHAGHDDGGALRRRRPHHRQRLEEGRLDQQPVGEELAAGTVDNPDLAVCGGVLQQALLLLGGTELHHRWPP